MVFLSFLLLFHLQLFNGDFPIFWVNSLSRCCVILCSILVMVHVQQVFRSNLSQIYSFDGPTKYLFPFLVAETMLFCTSSLVVATGLGKWQLVFDMLLFMFILSFSHLQNSNLAMIIRSGFRKKVMRYNWIKFLRQF